MRLLIFIYLHFLAVPCSNSLVFLGGTDTEAFLPLFFFCFFDSVIGITLEKSPDSIAAFMDFKDFSTLSRSIFNVATPVNESFRLDRAVDIFFATFLCLHPL